METDKEVMCHLWMDAAQQRQIISDRLMALHLQSNGSQQTYEDAEIAHAEQDRVQQLNIQFEFDRLYAHPLDQNGHKRTGFNNQEEKNQIATLFGVSIQACVSNKVDVAGDFSSAYMHKS
jgi:hypothetical protein